MSEPILIMQITICKNCGKYTGDLQDHIKFTGVQEGYYICEKEVEY